MNHLPNGWRLALLGDLATVQYGKARPKETGTIPVVGSGGIYGYAANPLIDYETIVIGRKGSAGATYYCPEPCHPSDTTFYLEWKSEVHVSFVYAWLQFKSLLPDKSVIPSLQRGDVESFGIALPPIEEQKAIAAVLRTTQDAIAARQQEAALERERKAALMQHLFTHGTRGEALKETAVGKIPKSWQVIKLGKLLDKSQYGLSIRGEKEGQYPILRMNNLVEGSVTPHDLQYVDLAREDFQNFKLKRGEILFNRTNSPELVGRTALFDLGGDFVFASYLIRIVPNQNHLISEYLNYYLNWEAAQNRLRMLATRGVSQSNISASKLKTFSIALPGVEEQKEIATILRACNDKIVTLEQEIAILNELFQALLEQLMTGQLSARHLAHPIVRSNRFSGAGEDG